MRMLMVATVASMIGQFNMNNISLLECMGYTVDVACNFEDTSVWTRERINTFKNELEDKNIQYYHIPFARSPMSLRMNTIAYKRLNHILKKAELADQPYSFIHCHTPVAGIIARLVGKQQKIMTVYTAHGFHFFKNAPLKNWIVFFPVEWFMSWYTDVLITINKEDYSCAKRFFHAGKVFYTPGVGIDTQRFFPLEHINSLDGKAALKAELGIALDCVVLLSVGELNENKNHLTVIKAISQLSNENVEADYIYLIVGIGEKKTELEAYIAEFNLHKKVKLLGYRKDVSDLMSVADIFIHPSFREGLSVSLMEAMASGLPVIASKIRGNQDLVGNNENGYLLSPADKEGFKNRILQLIIDRDQREVLGGKSLELIKGFDVTSVNTIMHEIYGGGGTLHLTKIVEYQQFCRSNRIPLGSFIILSVGELNINKNHQIIIRILDDLNKSCQDREVHYMIAGTGKEKEHLLDLAETYHVSDRLHLLGYCVHVDKLYHYADVFVFPSKREGLGVAAVEAMASGLPLVTSNIHGINDYSHNGLTGYKTDPCDLKGMTKALHTILNDRSVRVKMKSTNVLCSRKYDMEYVSPMMREIYKSVTVNQEVRIIKHDEKVPCQGGKGY